MIALENSQIALMTEVSYHQQSAKQKMGARNPVHEKHFSSPGFCAAIFSSWIMTMLFDGLSKRETTNSQHTRQRNLSHVSHVSTLSHLSQRCLLPFYFEFYLLILIRNHVSKATLNRSTQSYHECKIFKCTMQDM